jgi:hypothetical protein
MEFHWRVSGLALQWVAKVVVISSSSPLSSPLAGGDAAARQRRGKVPRNPHETLRMETFPTFSRFNSINIQIEVFVTQLIALTLKFGIDRSAKHNHSNDSILPNMVIAPNKMYLSSRIIPKRPYIDLTFNIDYGVLNKGIIQLPGHWAVVKLVMNGEGLRKEWMERPRDKGSQCGAKTDADAPLKSSFTTFGTQGSHGSQVTQVGGRKR